MRIIRLEEWKGEPLLWELTPEQLEEAYRLAREAFTADDLQKFTEVDEGVSAEEALNEMEEEQRRFDERKL